MEMDGWTMDIKFCGNSLDTAVGFKNRKKLDIPSQSEKTVETTLSNATDVNNGNHGVKVSQTG